MSYFFILSDIFCKLFIFLAMEQCLIMLCCTAINFITIKITNYDTCKSKRKPGKKSIRQFLR